MSKILAFPAAVFFILYLFSGELVYFLCGIAVIAGSLIVRNILK